MRRKPPQPLFPNRSVWRRVFDTHLLHRVADAVADEGRINYEKAIAADRHDIFEGLTFYSPNVNIFRDPRWGRGQETYGEDPYLTAQLGVAYITGLQGNDPKHLKVAATAKHFAVHSGPEPSRHVFDAVVSKHDLEDTYFPAFRAAVEEGKVAMVMCSYNAINGVPACANIDVLQGIVRDTWKFKGVVASDCNAVTDLFEPRHYANSDAAAASKALRAGTDNECVIDFILAKVPHSLKYVEAVKSGLLTESELDRALVRNFTVRFRLGMFDRTTDKTTALTLGEARLDNEARQKLNLEAARKTMVLLKNNGVLPLASNVKRILVTGSLAADRDVLLGNYHGRPPYTVTALEGIRKTFPQAEIVYEPGVYFPAEPSELVPDLVLTTNDGKPGLKAEFFAGATPSGTPFETRVVPNVDITDPATLLHKRGMTMTIQWTGWLTPNETGTYRLGVKGMSNRVSLDGKVVVDDTEPHAPDIKTAEVKLEKGRRYAITVESLPGPEQITQLVWQIIRPDVRERAIAAARSADLVIAVAGITSNLEGKEKSTDVPGFKGGDRTSLDMPQIEEDLLKNLKATRKPLVLVMMNGSAMSINWAKQHADAILEAWYPGQEGGTAIAETLAGKNNPAGRLPLTFYAGINQLPDFNDYSMAGRTYRYFDGTPLYRFGYGLSYSNFSYSKPVLSSRSIVAGKSLTASVTVKNTSMRDGDEVVQLYLGFPQLPGAPMQALRGFQRIHLKTGESRKVTFSLDPAGLSHVAPDGNRIVSAGRYELSLGGSGSGDVAGNVREQFTITGKTLTLSGQHSH